MNELTPMSFEVYEKNLNERETSENISRFEELMRTQTNPNQKKTVSSSTISPFVDSNDASVSASAKKRILDYAHPIDSSLVKKMDEPSLNAVLSKLVQIGIDANYSLPLSTGIHVTKNSTPEIYNILSKCADRLDIAIPYVVITDSIKGLNACACGTNQFTFIMISSLLPMVMNENELCFVIGHECGHIAMGHTLYHTAGQLIGTAGTLLPVVGDAIAATMTLPLNAWSRRSEITADRAGLICCGNLDAAKRALFRLQTGLYNPVGVDIDEYVKEGEDIISNSHLGRMTEYTHSHPLVIKRIKALEMFSKSVVYAESIGAAPTEEMITRKELNNSIERIIEVLDNPLK